MIIIYIRIHFAFAVCCRKMLSYLVFESHVKKLRATQKMIIAFLYKHAYIHDDVV